MALKSGTVDATKQDFFLGVERSVTGRSWFSRTLDERTALALTQRLGEPEVIGRVLAGRGVGLDEVETFLDPSLRRLLPDPSHLKGMEAATNRLARAVTQGEKMAVFGDYDVDGATSAALLARYVRSVGGLIDIYIPDRIDEGYGPNTEALLGLGRNGASLIVTVDCGTTAHEPLRAAAEAGIDVIVADHHEAEAALPPAVAVVNPNRLDEESPHKHMAAVGVTFLLVVGLNRALRDAGWFSGRGEPDIRQWLDLVALGTVCDVVPLVGVNRALVSRGLTVMGARGNPGLRALADVAGIDEPPGTYHAGYMLGPRINAGGRIGKSDLGARLLSTDDEVVATDIAARLDAYNRERQATELSVLNAALDQVETSGQAADGAGLIFVAGQDWHPGVVGIVAGRLAGRFHRPACVAAIDNGKATGSGRSIAGVDLGAAIIAARQSGHLLKGGGHVMAAGFSAETGKLRAVAEFLNSRLQSEIAVATMTRGLKLDGALAPGAATMELLAAIKKISPFGTGNPEPRFAIPDVRVSWAKVVGANHVSCTLNGSDGNRVRAIAFRAMDSELGPTLLSKDGVPLHIAGKLRINSWRGADSVQLFIDDAAPAW